MAEIILERSRSPVDCASISGSPGVGKTYHMLNDAYLMLHQQGIDVVIGLVEPHGRKRLRTRSAIWRSFPSALSLIAM